MIAVNRQEAETEDHACGPRRMLNEAQVLAIIPVGRTTLYRMEKTGHIDLHQPKPQGLVRRRDRGLAKRR